LIAWVPSVASAQNPTTDTWVPFPNPWQPGVEELAPRDLNISDMEILDVLVGSRARIFTTSDGWVDTDDPLNIETYPGQLRSWDFDLPLPDLLSGFNYLNQLWDEKDVDWSENSAVADWNSVLGGEPDPGTGYYPNYGKGGSLVGMTSVNGILFVGGPHRNDKALNAAGDGWQVSQWNGLSMLDGSSLSFNPANGELYSGGTGPTGRGTLTVTRGC
jgi:hypothetical protein